jgi:hypothetical protein
LSCHRVGRTVAARPGGNTGHRGLPVRDRILTHGEAIEGISITRQIRGWVERAGFPRTTPRHRAPEAPIKSRIGITTVLGARRTAAVALESLVLGDRLQIGRHRGRARPGFIGQSFRHAERIRRGAGGQPRGRHLERVPQAGQRRIHSLRDECPAPERRRRSGRYPDDRRTQPGTIPVSLAIGPTF